MIYQVFVSRTIDYVYEVDAPDEQTAKDNFLDGELFDESDGGYDVPWAVTPIDKENITCRFCEGETL